MEEGFRKPSLASLEEGSGNWVLQGGTTVSLLAPVCATSRGGHNYIIIIIIIVEGWKTYGSASGVECNINFIPAV